MTMTRESRARWLALATTALAVLLAALFAAWRNLTPATAMAPPEAAPADTAQIAAGRAAYVRLNCAMCHAIAGEGNPSLPLDGVGSRLDRGQLRDWTLGTGAAAAKLSPGLAQRKRRNENQPDIDALLDYLQQLR